MRHDPKLNKIKLYRYALDANILGPKLRDMCGTCLFIG